MKKIIITFIVIVCALGLYFVLRTRTPRAPLDTASVSETATTTSTRIGDVTVTTPSGYTISQVSIDEKKSSAQAPSLTTPIVFGVVSLTPEVKEIVSKKITDIRSTLIKDPKNISGWVNLGIYQKMAGDYLGAIASWKYVTQISSNDFVSRGNLGDLYAYYVHDNALAEMYYSEAIKAGPTQEYLYAQYALMYRDVFKDTEKALRVINDGLKKIPNSTVLMDIKTQIK